jgi:hypothetical protein
MKMSTQTNLATTTVLQAEIDRAVRQARADRAETIRAAVVSLNAAVKRFFAGLHRPAPRKGAAA